VGITTAKYPECKRGVATNFAASLARHSAVSARVCVVDADPLALDVTTRLAARGPFIEDFARPKQPVVPALARVESPSMGVLPSRGGPVARVHLAAVAALRELGEAFDLVVCDLPADRPVPGKRWAPASSCLIGWSWRSRRSTPRSPRRATFSSCSRLLETGATSVMSG
jgi:hypothetical protein